MCLNIRTMITLSTVTLICAACSIQKPEVNSVIEAFNYDVENYGYSTIFGRVQFAQSGNKGRDTGFQRNDSMQWMKDYGMAGNHQWLEYIDIVSIEISENESDRFPFRGIVNYSFIKTHRNTQTQSLQVVYLYGRETKKWIRKELITP